jgi:AcrR family transcriptional regulator
MAVPRARSGDAKQNRRAHILDTALDLWESRSYAHFTMGDVAERSGLARSTLYLYFPTREELLLALLEQLLGEWFAALNAELHATPGEMPAAAAAALIGETLGQRPALTRLLPIASSILEHNISPAAARAYKEQLLTWAGRSGALLEQRMPFLGAGGGVWLLLQVYALVLGLGQMADPAPVVAEILAESHMEPLRIDFGPALRRALMALLRGIEAGAASEERHD